MLQDHLGLCVPVTIADLKSAYRRRAKELHPDLNPHGTELFKTFQEVYEWLTSPDVLRIIVKIGEAEYTTCTTDGTPLSELGLGFDNTKNGRDCGYCNHRGYHKVVEERYHICRECSGCGYTYANACDACKGTGKFTQKNSKRVVDCLRCKGKGTIHYGTLSRCRADGCNRGYVSRATERVTYQTCWTCKGIGEIEIYNPVIPKGLLTVRKGR